MCAGLYRSRVVLAALAVSVLLASLSISSVSAAPLRGDVLSLAVPGLVSVGQRAELYGYLSDRSSRRPIRGGTVTFYYEAKGARSWTAITTEQTNGNGYFQAIFTIPSAVYFAVYFRGNSDHLATWSAAELIGVRSVLPPDGTSYWNPADDCHYHVANGTLYGDYCVAYQTDSSGNAIKTIYNVYAYDDRVASHVGALQYQLNTAYPDWIVWRVPSDPEFQTVLWASVPRNNINAEPEIEIYFNGHWVWTTVSKLQQLVAALQALLAAEQQQGITPAPTDIVTVGGASETPPQLTDLVNGVDKLGGNAQLGQEFSSVYSIGISEPFTPGPCGEVGYYCYPD
jgi:hypothetical protein